jgi:rod shape-determining protein MreC
MQQIIDFFIRNKNFLLFALLFIIALQRTKSAHNYHQTRYLGSTHIVGGSFFQWKASITDYFDLAYQNEVLARENKNLRTQLLNSKDTTTTVLVPSTDTLNFDHIRVQTAKVINNNFHKTKNQLTLNRGRLSGMEIDMGVVSPQGVVGIVTHVSDHYALVQSILNTQSKIVAKFQKSQHFGTLTWDGFDPTALQLLEIPKIAPIAVGDTLVTDGKSTIFPEGLPIGVVVGLVQEPSNDYYNITVAPFTDMTSVKQVYAVRRRDANEILTLEQQGENGTN